MVYLISYRLNKPGQDYPDLYEAIKKISGTWWHHTTSAWVVESTLTAEDVYKRLAPCLDPNDDLMVFRLQGNWHGRLADSTDYDWLRARTF